MSPHKPRGRTIYRVRVPTRTGAIVKSTGTRDPARARRIEAMLRELGPRERRAWDLLDAVREDRLSLATLYDAYREDALPALRSRLRDADLAPHMDIWLDTLAGSDDAAARHRRALTSFRAFVGVLDGPWPASSLTVEQVTRWLAHEGGASATRRWHAAGLTGFARYLHATGVLPSFALEGLTLPKVRLGPVEFFELDEVQRVVDAATEPCRSLFAFLYGTGADLSPALAITPRDVDTDAKVVRVRGGKTPWRDRLCLVASWAWPIVEARLKGRLPSAPLWPGLTRYAASDEHRRLVKLLKLRALPLRKSRHHWAVRMLRTGAPIELVARQLGHKDGTLALKVYGRFLPRTEDMAKWEAVASGQVGTKASKRRAR